MSSSHDFDCDWFRYKDDPQPLGSKYRSKHFKIAAAAHRYSVQFVLAKKPCHGICLKHTCKITMLCLQKCSFCNRINSLVKPKMPACYLRRGRGVGRIFEWRGQPAAPGPAKGDRFETLNPLTTPWFFGVSIQRCVKTVSIDYYLQLLLGNQLLRNQHRLPQHR